LWPRCWRGAIGNCTRASSPTNWRAARRRRSTVTNIHRPNTPPATAVFIRQPRPTPTPSCGWAIFPRNPRKRGQEPFSPRSYKPSPWLIRSVRTAALLYSAVDRGGTLQKDEEQNARAGSQGRTSSFVLRRKGSMKRSALLILGGSLLLLGACAGDGAQ